jgi:hypothetical protein
MGKKVKQRRKKMNSFDILNTIKTGFWSIVKKKQGKLSKRMCAALKQNQGKWKN